MTAEEDLNEPLLQSIKKRLPWLLALLGLGIVVSSVVGAFEKVVEQLTMIMAFQSLILDMAGNVGTQSLAVTIRVYRAFQAKGFPFCVLCIRMHRNGASARDAGFQRNGYADSLILQKNQYRSRCRVRSVDHHGE